MKILIIILSLLTFSCSNIKRENSEKGSRHFDVKTKLKSIDNWNLIEYKEGVIDTNEVNLLTTPQIFALLENKSQQNCLKPRVEFYPIDLKDHVSEKLSHYLTIRSTFFPVPPKRYTTNEYYILIWDFNNYFNKKCCDCDDLEKLLKEKLKMSPTITINTYE